MAAKKDRFERAIDIFRKHGGVLRTSQALKEGIHPATFYEMADTSTTIQLSRGLYRLADSPPLSDPDLAVVAIKIPQSVVCLISALAYYELTTQVPHQVYVALTKGAEEPRIDYPPIRTFRFSARAFTEGIDTVPIAGATIKIYNREKTIADCFKFRNKIGIETALEALKFYKESSRLNIGALMRYAAVCRVSNVIRPYLEAIV